MRGKGPAARLQTNPHLVSSKRAHATGLPGLSGLILPLVNSGAEKTPQVPLPLSLFKGEYNQQKRLAPVSRALMGKGCGWIGGMQRQAGRALMFRLPSSRTERESLVTLTVK